MPPAPSAGGAISPHTHGWPRSRRRIGILTPGRKRGMTLQLLHLIPVAVKMKTEELQPLPHVQRTRDRMRVVNGLQVVPLQRPAQRSKDPLVCLEGRDPEGEGPSPGGGSDGRNLLLLLPGLCDDLARPPSTSPLRQARDVSRSRPSPATGRTRTARELRCAGARTCFRSTATHPRTGVTRSSGSRAGLPGARASRTKRPES
jgi:hypothetical protein